MIGLIKLGWGLYFYSDASGLKRGVKYACMLMYRNPTIAIVHGSGYSIGIRVLNGAQKGSLPPAHSE